jgi:hypothetical protein
MSFKDQFLAMKPGPARENLIYNEIIKRGPPKNMVPVTVPGPSGSTITYRVMPDYMMIDGIRVPMSGQTAQKVADYFGMNLPTPKMSKQIYNAADTKIMPTPLSAGGVIGGKHYTGQEVVDRKISDSDASLAYNQLIQKELAKQNKDSTLVAGHMKDIVQPQGDPNKLGLYGWYGKDGKPVQYSAQTPHDTSVHTEYGSGVRLVADEVTVKLPSGKTVTTTMDKLMANPNFGKVVSDTRGVSKYTMPDAKKTPAPARSPTKTEPTMVADKGYQPPRPQSGRLTLLQRIDNFLNSIG